MRIESSCGDRGTKRVQIISVSYCEDGGTKKVQYLTGMPFFQESEYPWMQWRISGKRANTVIPRLYKGSRSGTRLEL